MNFKNISKYKKSLEKVMKNLQDMVNINLRLKLRSNRNQLGRQYMSLFEKCNFINKKDIVIHSWDINNSWTEHMTDKLESLQLDSIDSKDIGYKFS